MKPILKQKQANAEENAQKRVAGLPRVCTSMKHVEEIYGVPVEFLKYVRANGGGHAFESSNRVQVVPMFKAAAGVLKKLGLGLLQATTDEAPEDIDKNLQQARVARETANQLARENALADEVIHTRDALKDELWELGLKQVADDLKNYENGPWLRAEKILKAAGVAPETIAAVKAEAVGGVSEPLKKLRTELPEKMGEAK